MLIFFKWFFCNCWDYNMIFMILIFFLQKHPTIFFNIFWSLSSNLEALMLIPVASKRGNLGWLLCFRWFEFKIHSIRTFSPWKLWSSKSKFQKTVDKILQKYLTHYLVHKLLVYFLSFHSLPFYIVFILHIVNNHMHPL